MFPRGAGRGVLVRALALGAVGYAMQAGLYFLALERMDASVLSLVLYSYPALVTGAAILLGREVGQPPASRRPRHRVRAASCSCSRAPERASFDLAGMALGAGAALTYTTYILVSDGVTAKLEALPAGRAGLAPARRCRSASWPRRPARWTSASTPPAGSGSAARRSSRPSRAVVLFFSGMSRVGPSTAAILSTLEPPVTVALVFVTFGEALGAVQILGALAVLGAAVIVNLPSRDRHSCVTVS